MFPNEVVLICLADYRNEKPKGLIYYTNYTNMLIYELKTDARNSGLIFPDEAGA